MRREEHVEVPPHVLRRDARLDVKQEAFPRELVDDRHPLEPPAALGHIEQEVVAPDLIRPRRAEPDASALARAEPASSALLPRYLKSRLPPEPVHPARADRPAFAVPLSLLTGVMCFQGNAGSRVGRVRRVCYVERVRICPSCYADSLRLVDCAVWQVV